jgi:hypothetical protein
VYFYNAFCRGFRMKDVFGVGDEHGLRMLRKPRMRRPAQGSTRWLSNYEYANRRSVAGSSLSLKPS